MTIRHNGVTLDSASATQEMALGQIYEANDGKAYKYVVYNEATAAVAGVAGEVAYYYLLDGYKNNEVTSDVSDATGGIGAGVLQAALADGEYGWVQIEGPATLTIALTAGTDGDNLTPTGAGDGTLDLVTAATDDICATAGDISDMEINCKFTR